MLAYDTETTGVDFWHGTKPFFVSTCDEKGDQLYWGDEWSVDPFTRQVSIPQEDIRDIRDLLRSNPIVGHNLKFDVRAMWSIDPSVDDWWNWDTSEDTIVAAHILGSAHKRDLTTVTLQYLNIDITSFENELGDCVKEARKICGTKEFISKNGLWNLAKKGNPNMPSLGKTIHKSDYWLPGEMYKRFDWIRIKYPRWKTILRDYGNTDTSATMSVWKVLKARMERKKLIPLYRSRMKTVPVIYRMEGHGLTMNKTVADEMKVQYVEVSERKGNICKSIARIDGFEVELPKSGGNDSLQKYFFEHLGLEKTFKKKQKTDKPTLDANAMKYYLDTLPERSSAYSFVKNLLHKRKVDVSVSFLDAYKRFSIPVSPGYVKIHPSVNPTGTGVTRRSSSNPNEQNISNKKDDEGTTIRRAFGPSPGREWYSLDYANLELRIPAYAALEPLMVDLFENPKKAPYFGSYHLLVAHILWQKEFDECLAKGWVFKERYEDTLYHYTKAGNFAVQYGAMPESGTADRAYHQQGAQLLIMDRFSEIKKLTAKKIQEAKTTGFVETMPDKDVDPRRGYPVMAGRTDSGWIRPTTPFSYFVQGTAGRIAEKALQRTDEAISEWNREAGKDTFRIVAEVHDEIVFDFPRGRLRNKGRVAELKRLMELSGDDIGVPLKVDVSYHPTSWAENE